MKNGFRRILLGVHYKLYSILNIMLPKKQNYIFLYDARFMRQNCWELYKYLIQNEYNKKYRIIYYVSKSAIQKSYMSDFEFETSIIRGWYLHLISKYTFYEYHNNKFNCETGRNQISVYLTHGMPLKNYGYLIETPDHPYENDYSYLLVTSEFYIPIMKRVLGCTDEKVYLGGMPRCDQLFTKKNIPSIVDGKHKNILWMPTVRNSSENKINDSSHVMPILSEANIDDVDRALKERNIRLIIKPHPLQNDIPWLKKNKYGNICVVQNEDLAARNIELYELIANVDMLLTDYSSVFSDYLLTDKPIAFVIDDIDEYRKNRGFVDDKLLDMIPGPIVSNYDDFISCLTAIDVITEQYRGQRKKLQTLLSPYPNGTSFSNDLCTFFGIVNDGCKS